MRMKCPALCVLALGLPSAVLAAAPAASSSGEACYAYSQARMHDCLVGKQKESAAALKTAEDKVMSALSRWDEDPKYVMQAKENLTKANAAFDGYRDAQCALAHSLGGGAIGNALEARRLACVIELNDKRAAVLSQMTNRIPSR